MPNQYVFSKQLIDSLIGGVAAIDVKRLRIQNLNESYEFINAYGYNLNNEKDRALLWNFHRRAVTFIREELLNENEEIPEALTDPNQLNDLAYLLIYASTQDKKTYSMQYWSCAILRVMHVLVHLENDMFLQYSTEIQDQVLKPFYDVKVDDPLSGGLRFVGKKISAEIRLKKFEAKSFKSLNSSMIKLLVKPEAVAFRILDKVGVRIVTRTIFDCYRVLRFLVDENIISFPHIIPSQSTNNIYPSNLFLQQMETITANDSLTPEQIDEKLLARLHESQSLAEFQVRENEFSASDYRFIKFIARRLIDVTSYNEKGEEKQFSFFYPFEVQLMDYATYLNNLSEADHESYKLRQKKRARLRVFGKPPIDRKENHND